MWFKLCLLLVYILLLFILSRVLEAMSWCELGFSGTLSRQLLDPMVLSVAKLKALLEQRGVSYEGVVEKSELTSLVDASGAVSAEEAELCQREDVTSAETNFTSGAHFIEQVEDAKDSVWLVQVVSHSGQYRVLSDSRWKTIQRKVSKFGVRTGFLDCSLDMRYCSQKGWQLPFLLLALPSQFEKKASVAMYNYSGSVRETAVLRWVRDKLDERIVRIESPDQFQQEWQSFSGNQLNPEIHVVLFTEAASAPMFYSALTVKFPGRVKFGLVCLQSDPLIWRHILEREKVAHIPAYVVYTTERVYTFGLRPGEQYSFPSMERFLKFLHPCLNDIFIISFCVANIMSWFELFILNCSVLKRLRKLIWCVFKYNMVVIMLWLPVIGIFQMPYLDRVPLAALKIERIVSTSQLGIVLRGDYDFYMNHPLYILVSFTVYLMFVTTLCKKYRQQELEEEDWFNFSQMRTLTHLRPNDFFEPMRISGYDLMGGLEVFGSQLSRPSLWLQPTISPDYIKHLPTWRYSPVSLATRAARQLRMVESAIGVASETSVHDSSSKTSHSTPRGASDLHFSPCASGIPSNNTTQTAKLISPSQHGSSHLTCKCSQEPSRSSCLGTSTIKSTVTSHCPKHHRAVPSRDHQSVQNMSRFPTHVQLEQDGEPFVQPSPNIAHICQDQDSNSARRHDNPCTTSNPVFKTRSEAVFDSSSDVSQSTPASDISRSTISAASESVDPHPTSSVEDSKCNSRAPPGDDYVSDDNGFPNGYLESHQCVICLDEYVPQTMLCGLPCGHVFHETCIISWLNKEKHFCPMCRWPSYKLKTPHQV